ncbi:MAG: hypothetical protein Q9164_005261 [Protoblastenia rupestris]
MKAAIVSSALALASTISANPIEKRQDFTKIEYPPGTGENLPSYPPGTGENLPSYPPGTGENLPFYPNTGDANPVFNFTSTYNIVLTPDQVVNGTTDITFTGGLPGSKGFFNYGINSDLELICFSLTITGFRGEFQSLARTATHIHEAAKGKNGPARIVFPNPEGDENVRYSFGCQRGPFTTGLAPNGVDTGTGFKLSQIEANPSGFMTDFHSSLAVPGAARGQFPG